MILKILVEIEAPDDATHFFGDLMDEPDWVKCKEIAGFDHWFVFVEGKGWIFLGHLAKPNWAKRISDFVHV